MPAEATAPRHRLQAALAEGLRRCAVIAERSPPPVEGRLTRIVGLTLEAVGCNVPLGGRCRLYGGGGQPVEAEVVGFDAERTFLMPIDDLYGLLPGARVRPGQHRYELPVGEDMLGRVIDGRGRPLDGRGAWRAEARRPLYADPINPLARRPIDTPLDVGVRAINGLFTVGRGQRMGLFAGSGVGKSVLLGMMTRYTQADVTVVGSDRRTRPRSQ
ncbi:MAG: hypothetical protein KatS3mg121_1437 [Gammaproteobacteria bacterium]|nr:MAG: hypothetical protein KatS3mg121_1437 [Gammaproteobacteria bacterium]